MLVLFGGSFALVVVFEAQVLLNFVLLSLMD
jgi:hypothetical protein